MKRCGSIIAGAVHPDGSSEFRVISPVTSTALDGRFPYATREQTAMALDAADAAHGVLLSLPRRLIAGFLRQLSARLAEARAEIVERCILETGLDPATRVEPEFSRMLGQLVMFAELTESGFVAEPRLVTAMPDRAPRPRPDLRRSRIGIGPVVNIEPSNFPLAFGACGSDTASAWAASCPVIVKSHPLHAGTSEMIARIVVRAVEENGLPPGMFSLIHGGPEQVLSLVRDSRTRGVSFTGSRRAGRAIVAAAAERSVPLAELSLEMGSANPVFVLAHVLKERPEAIAEMIAGSVLLGAGQFCTKPGIIFFQDGQGSEEFLCRLRAVFQEARSATLLSSEIAGRYCASVDMFRSCPGVTVLGEAEDGADTVKTQVKPVALVVPYADFVQEESLAEEVFGPFVLVVRCRGKEVLSAAAKFTGELTASIHHAASDIEDVQHLAAMLLSRVGRLVFNGVPTGVEVCDALNHSGPWPSAHGRFTATGPGAVERWLRPFCWQNAPAAVLPADLQDEPQPGEHRWVDGRYL